MDRTDTSTLVNFDHDASFRTALTRVAVPQDSPIICLSHLRWNFVFQRPQHLMSAALKTRRVIFWEEPRWDNPADLPEGKPRLELSTPVANLTVAVPVFPWGMDITAIDVTQSAMLSAFVASKDLNDAVLWYYTPAALTFSEHLARDRTVIYDAMDELSAFAGADPALPELERRLLGYADVVFTGGFSLYEAKRHQHENMHPFPSGVDVEHFRPARAAIADPVDQAQIPHPRIGFYGVIDERLDIDLLARVAEMRPDWQIVMVGPIVKIDENTLPRGANVHYLGGKTYNELPRYLSGWDVAVLPFARNESTRFISPTKTPEYLAGGRPVVSTPITDVIRHYGHVQAVRIAETPAEFIAAIESGLAQAATPGDWLVEADEMLAACSWRGIWSRMSGLLQEAEARTSGSMAPQAQAVRA